MPHTDGSPRAPLLGVPRVRATVPPPPCLLRLRRVAAGQPPSGWTTITGKASDMNEPPTTVRLTHQPHRGATTDRRTPPNRHTRHHPRPTRRPPGTTPTRLQQTAPPPFGAGFFAGRRLATRVGQVSPKRFWPTRTFLGQNLIIAECSASNMRWTGRDRDCGLRTPGRCLEGIAVPFGRHAGSKHIAFSWLKQRI